MDAYLARHDGLAGVTTDMIAGTFHWSNPLIPMLLTNAEAQEVAAASEEALAEITADEERLFDRALIRSYTVEEYESEMPVVEAGI